MKKSGLILAVFLCLALLLTASLALAESSPALEMPSNPLKIGRSYTVCVDNLPSGTAVTWSSSDEKVVTVKASSVEHYGSLTAIAPGTATVTAKIDGYDDLSAECSVQSVALTETDFSLKIGGFKIIYVESIAVEDAMNTDFAWSSDNPDIATVEPSASGEDMATVWAVSPGTTAVKVVINGVYTLSANVTVTGPKLNITSAKVLVGESIDLKLSDTRLSSSSLEWTSSDPVVASVGADRYFGNTRTITALSPGTAVISISYESRQIASAKITVPEAKLTPASFRLGVKKTKELKVTGIGSVAYNELKWSSSKRSVAKVDKYGTVTGVSVGTATISVRINKGKTYSCKVTVEPAFASDTEYVAVGEELKLNLVGLPKGAKVTWKSSKPKIATVSKKGVVKAGKKTGTTTVSVKYNKKTYKVKVVVKPKVEITVRRITDTSIYNEVYVDFQNYSNKPVVYIKLDIAQFDNAGRKLKSPYSYYYLNETIKARGSLTNWEYWVNGDTKKVKITIREVTFKGGSKWKP